MNACSKVAFDVNTGDELSRANETRETDLGDKSHCDRDLCLLRIVHKAKQADALITAVRITKVCESFQVNHSSTFAVVC